MWPMILFTGKEQIEKGSKSYKSNEHSKQMND